MKSSKSFKANVMSAKHLSQEVRLVEAVPAGNITFGKGGIEENRVVGTMYTFDCLGRRLSVFLPVGTPAGQAWKMAKAFFVEKGGAL